MDTDVDGNVLIIGAFYGVVDFDPGTGVVLLDADATSPVFLASFSGSGDLLWASQPGDEFSSGYASRVRVGPAQEAYVQYTWYDPGVMTESSGDEGARGGVPEDLYIERWSDAGALVWSRYLSSLWFPWPDLAIGSNAGVFTSASFNGTMDMDPNTGVVELTAVASNQDVLVHKMYQCLTVTSIASATACDEYTWSVNGATYATSGTYQDTLPRFCGGDSIIVLDLTVNYSSAGSQAVTACDSYTWSANGNTYGQSGTYTAVLPNTSGCDSTATLNLVIGTSYAFVQTVAACNSYVWPVNGIGYAEDGTYTALFQTVLGCDSLYTLELTLTPGYQLNQNAIACDSYTWDANGNTYTQSGTYTANLTTVAGCDSILILNLIISTSYAFEETAEACDNYLWPVNGQNYTAGGSYTATYQTALGCDSIYTLELDLTPSYVLNADAIACDSYTWGANGTTYTQSGTYTLNLTTVAGCDSILTLTLGINESSASTQTAGACISYTWAANGQTYDQSGTYIAELTTVNGCDSIVTLELTISDEAFGSESVTACDSYTWAGNGTTYDQSGTYTAALTSTQGCDSTATLFLTVNYSASGGEFVSACESYTWSANGETYTESGLYNALISTVLGCDSVASLALEISHGYQESQTATAGDSYTWAVNGETYDASGSHTESFTTSNGCDSTITLDLTVYTSSATTENVSTCDAYTWDVNGETYTASGLYTETFTTVNGCDSIRTLDLDLGQSNGGTEVVGACLSYTWPADGETYSATGLYFTVLTNASGCDSIATLDLTISDEAFSSETVSTCGSYTWPANGETYAETGTYSVTLPGSQGCDSTVTLFLTVNEATTGSEQADACDSFTWNANGETYVASGTYTATLSTTAGCDSLVTLDLTVYITTHDTSQASACGSYEWQGQTLTESGSYTVELTSPEGCISTETLELTFGLPNAGSEEVTACGSYTWPATGETYTQSGPYTITLVNAQGCDSTATLVLDVITLAMGITLDGDTLEVAQEGGVYQWVDCGNNNSPVPGATSQTYTPTVIGSYAVSVTLGGCTELSVCTQVNVGLAEGSFSDGITVGPNPTEGMTTLSFGAKQERVTVQVIDALGQVVAQRRAKNTDRMNIDLPVTSGLYLLAVESGAGERAVVRVVVR